MDIFDVLRLLGGLSMFLFGMGLMGDALEKRAGGSLKAMLERLTGRRLTGFLMGLGVTAVIQSSSATTVMVVGFVNSGIMSLAQAINVIMGANVGTTVTAWILSLTGIEGSNIFVQLLKPTSFTPLLAIIGVYLYMMTKVGKRRDTGLILLGFATLMFGMDTMSGAVSGLGDVPAFKNILLAFSNPLLGAFAGALLTAIIQSSSASVGILQALSATGAVSYAAAIPIIMGQNIGTCVTALISSVGANKNAKRAATVHLCFNVIGTLVWLAVFSLAKALLDMPFIYQQIDQMGIAVVHTGFNLLCTALMLPMAKQLERLAYLIIPDREEKDEIVELDERLMATPALAVQQSRSITADMAKTAGQAITKAIELLTSFSAEAAEEVRKAEDKTDYYEDVLGSYLVKLSARQMSETDSREAGELLHMIGDLERLGDHAVNIVEAAEELHEKKLGFSAQALQELKTLTDAVNEIVDLSISSFLNDDLDMASKVEPLEELVDMLREQLRSRHILRLQTGVCSIETGFIWLDLLTNLERIADHCSNIALCVLEKATDDMELHNYQQKLKAHSPSFSRDLEQYAIKYALPEKI